MKTLSVSVEPTANLNVSTVEIDYRDFDPHVGLSFWATYKNQSQSIIDRVSISLSLEQWQSWGPSGNDQTDENYVVDCVLLNLGLTTGANPLVQW